MGSRTGVTPASQYIKRPIGIDVLTAARQRIAYTFDNFERVYISYSGGKDSTVMLHLVMDEAIARHRRVGVLFIDLEGQYRITIESIAACLEDYRDNIEPYWVALPIHLRNAVSAFEPFWLCWAPDARAAWVREPPESAITDESFFPFFSRGMEFEEFVPEFGRWYGKGEPCACGRRCTTASSGRLALWMTYSTSIPFTTGALKTCGRITPSTPSGRTTACTT
jgi:predicted phosphoadenosine phosphosulfate sulfurtransferase